MICILDGRLLAADAVRCILAAVPPKGPVLLSADPPSIHDTTWEAVGRERRGAIHDVLQESFRRRPDVNNVLIVWSLQDQSLLDLLQCLNAQDGNYSVVISVLLVGVLKPNNDFDPILKLQSNDAGGAGGRLVNTLWYLGNEDQNGNRLNSDVREESLSHFLRVVLSGKDADFGDRGLRVFPGNRERPAFTAFGVKSWAPSTKDAVRLVRITGAELLQENMGAVDPARQKAMRDEVSSLFNRLNALQTPYAADQKNASSIPYSEQLPPVPDHPFSGWQCPIFRQKAMEKGELAIGGHKSTVYQYRTLLLESLSELGSIIRDNGQKVFRKAREEYTQFIRSRNPDIAHVGSLLQVYFPGFAAKSARASQGGCEPASTPDRNVCDQWFVKEAKGCLVQECARLPKVQTALLVACVALGLGGFSVLLLKCGVQWRFGVMPGLFGLVGLVGFLFWAAYLAGKVSIAMRKHFDSKYSELRLEFVNKLTWLVDKTQILLERQAKGDILRIGRRLRASMDQVFPENDQAASVSRDEIKEVMDRVLATNADKEFIRESMRQAVLVILDGAISDSSEIDRAEKTGTIITKLTRDLVVRTSSRLFDPSRARKAVFECVNRNSPPLLVHDSGRLSAESSYIKVFVLPDKYPSDWEAIIQAQSSPMSLECRFIRGSISAPAVFSVRMQMIPDDVANSLQLTEVAR